MIPFILTLCFQGPPPGSPFPPMRDLPKLSMLAEWLNIGRNQLGWPEPYTLLYVSMLLEIPGYDLRQGVGPILLRLP